MKTNAVFFFKKANDQKGLHAKLESFGL